MRRRRSYDQLVQRRTKLLFYLLLICYVALAGRLFYIQVIRAPYFKARAEEMTVARVTLFAKRGAIYDRHGNKLAMSVEAYEILVRPIVIADKRDTADRLAPLIDWDAEDLYARLNSRDRPFYLMRKVDMDIGLRVQDAGLQGIDVIRTMKRIYPGDGLASHIIGYTDVDGKGIEGLEQAYDDILRGTDGHVIAERDARGKIIPGSRRERVEPVHGKDLILTIDSTLQHALETELEKAYLEHSAAGASAIMVNPQTGEILALANMPGYKPDAVAESDAASRRNRAVTDLYEPGSTLKTMTVAAALDAEAVRPSDTFECTGSMPVGRRSIGCPRTSAFPRGHGTSDVTRVMRFSCNIGTAVMGLRLGKEKLYSYAKDFGLYDKPNSGMLGEARGWQDRWQDWPDIRVTNIAFGQGIAVTPLQMVMAYAVIANDGVLMQPYVVKEIRRADGSPETVFEPQEVRRVISRETARMVTDMLEDVVVTGTGKAAKVDGYRVAGKTGSAQKASINGRGYVRGKYISSFIGFLPVSDPKAVVLVAVDEPSGAYWGSVVAAPVFREASRRSMWHMRVSPDDLPDLPAPIAETEDERRIYEPRPSGRTQLGG